MAKLKKAPPFAFVLEELADLDLVVKPMFGCHALYVNGERLVLMLRLKDNETTDNGLWLATAPEHHESLQKVFPSMRSLEMFGPGPTGWQNLPSESPDFEESALKVCDLIRRGDPRIGKFPKKKSRRS